MDFVKSPNLFKTPTPIVVNTGTFVTMNPQWLVSLELVRVSGLSALISYKVSKRKHEYGTFKHMHRAEICLPKDAHKIIIIPSKHAEINDN